MNHVRSFLVVGLFLIAGYNLVLYKNPAKADNQAFSSILQSASISALADMGNKLKAKGNDATELETEAFFKKSCQFFKKVHADLSSTNFRTEKAKQLQAQFLNQKSSIDQSCKELDKTDASKDKGFINQTISKTVELIGTMQTSLKQNAESLLLTNTLVGKLKLPLFFLVGLILLLVWLKSKKPNNWIDDSLSISAALIGFSGFFSTQLGAIYILPTLCGFIYLCFLLLKQRKVDTPKAD